MQQFENFLLAIDLSFDFYKVITYINYEELIHKFSILSIALARSGTHFSVMREMTCVKRYKNIILESNEECAKGLLRWYHTLQVKFDLLV